MENVNKNNNNEDSTNEHKELLNIYSLHKNSEDPLYNSTIYPPDKLELIFSSEKFNDDIYTTHILSQIDMLIYVPVLDESKYIGDVVQNVIIKNINFYTNDKLFNEIKMLPNIFFTMKFDFLKNNEYVILKTHSHNTKESTYAFSLQFNCDEMKYILNNTSFIYFL